MSIPLHLIQAAAHHHAQKRRTALVVRHAARHPVTDLARHEEVLLTEEGLATALSAGREQLAAFGTMRAFHSPVQRCVQTARALVQGAVAGGANALLMTPVPLLGSSFVVDEKRAYDIVMQRTGTFLREWFDGELPPEVFEPRASAGPRQLQAIIDATLAHGRDTMTVLVTHDWNIALLREQFLSVPHEGRWPGFLDGFVVAVDDDYAHVQLQEHTARVHRRALTT